MYNNKEPRMSQREKHLTEFTRRGEYAYKHHGTRPLSMDNHETQAWENGYRIAGEKDGNVYKYAD